MSKKNKKEKNDTNVNVQVENETKEGYVQRLEGEIEEAVVKDPLFSFLQKWSNFIFWVCIFLALGFLGYQKYQQVRENSRAEYADVFNTLRNHYSNLLTLKTSIEEKKLEIEQAKKEEVENKEKDLQDLQKDYDVSLNIANESLKSILDSRDYKDIAKMYSALLLKLQGKDDEFKKELSEFNCENFETIEDSEKAFFAEFCAIVLAKDNIEKGKLDDAKQALVKICEKGKYFNLVAYKTLSSILPSEDSELLDNLKSGIIVLHPALESSL